MNVLGIGTDIIECERIAQMIAKHKEIFVDRVFTPYEVDYCGKRKSAVQHYAGRWAAKEAILKAMGTGWAKGIKWRDLEIQTLPGGQPVVHLGGVAKDVCESKGITQMLISISHTKEYATAVATAIGIGPAIGPAIGIGPGTSVEALKANSQTGPAGNE